MNRIDERMRRSDREVRGAMEERSRQADLRAREMGKDMPLDEYVPFNAAEAEEDLAQRVTEDTGGHGDPHAHNEQKADKISRQMTEDTGVEGDITKHAQGKVDQMGQEMFE